MKYTLKIKKNKIIKYVLKKGEYSSSKSITIHCLKTNFRYKDSNFFCVCISKKNGNSVQRNKLKRWAREVYKEEELNIKKGYNIVLLYRKNITVNDVDFLKIKEEFIKCLKELGVYEKQV